MFRDMHIKYFKIVDWFQNLAFDLKHGVETRREVLPYDFLVRSTNIKHATRYQASHVRLIRKTLDKLKLPLDKYTFVDIGSGKGRALMIASLYGFKRVIGVEFAENLISVCKNNLSKFGAEAEVYEGDILEMSPMNAPCVYFFFNPFDQLMVKKFISNHLLESKFVDEHIIASVNPRTEFQFNLAGFEKFDEVADPNFNKYIHFYRYKGI